MSEDQAASIAYLRERGVEVELPEERAAKAAARAAAVSASQSATGRSFRFVRIPAERTEEVTEETAHAADSGAPCDTLKNFLAPRFSDDTVMDESTVARETAARLKNMMVGGGIGETLTAPSAGELQRQALGGVCEAWPLAQASSDNGERAVRLYIDEVGALRARPRNARAEALASAAGLSGVSIHGDAYVGRCERLESGGERSVDFALAELAHDSSWVLAARRAHEAAAASAGHRADELFVSGTDTAGGWSWSQGEEDVEVRVTRGVPSDLLRGGKAAKKRVAVSYGGGDALRVALDGSLLVELPKLFDRVTPDECTWTLTEGPSGAEIVVTMEKAEPRPWTSLELGISL